MCHPSAFVTACSAAVMCGVSAHADVSILEFSGMDSFEQIQYAFDTTSSWDAPKEQAQFNAFSGCLTFNNGSVKGFCIELAQDITRDPASYESFSLDGKWGFSTYRVQLMASLFDTYYSDVIASKSDAKSSAFQMMVWELTHENFSDSKNARAEISLSNGATQFEGYSVEAGVVFSEMQDQLMYQLDTSRLNGLRNENYQDFVTYQVPGPSAIALSGIALLMGRSRRRR